MADDVIDANANALRVAFKAKATGMSAVTCDELVRLVVKRQGVDAFPNKLVHQVKRARIDDCRPLDAFNVRRVINQSLRRTDLAFGFDEFYLVEPCVKVRVTLLIFLAASAPTRVVSLHTSQHLLEKPYHIIFCSGNRVVRKPCKLLVPSP